MAEGEGSLIKRIKRGPPTKPVAPPPVPEPEPGIDVGIAIKHGDPNQRGGADHTAPHVKDIGKPKK